jgi:hypothetical protein
MMLEVTHHKFVFFCWNSFVGIINSACFFFFNNIFIRVIEKKHSKKPFFMSDDEAERRALLKELHRPLEGFT